MSTDLRPRRTNLQEYKFHNNLLWKMWIQIYVQLIGVDMQARMPIKFTLLSIYKWHWVHTMRYTLFVHFKKYDIWWESYQWTVSISTVEFRTSTRYHTLISDLISFSWKHRLNVAMVFWFIVMQIYLNI